jgi:hypothetical protein
MLTNEGYLWSYATDDGRWVLFNDVDQVNLENSDSAVVTVRGGRCDVDKHERIMTFIYTAEQVPVSRSSWFAGDVPYSEDDCLKISDWVLTRESETTPLLFTDNRKISKLGDGKLSQSGPSIMSASVPIHRVSDPTFPIKPPSANGDDPSVPAEHLLICVHGIGESLWSKKAFNRQPFGSGIDTFRSLIAEYSIASGCNDSRIEVLHVTWFHILSESEYAKMIPRISLPTVPVLRQFANGAVSDVLFYLTDDHRRKVIDHVSERIVGLYTTFCQRQSLLLKGKSLSPPKLSLMGHSLGSVICYDILSQGRLAHDISIDKFFLFGSPLGIFLTSRGESELLPLARCGAVMNVYQPTDPVAYRLEPLINEQMANTDAALVPYHLTGGMSTRTKLTQATSSILGLFQSTPDRSTSSTYEKLSQLVKGNISPRPNSPIGIAIREVEARNGGKRLDWSLQHESLVTNEYADALTAHMSYLSDRSVARFVSDQLNPSNSRI